MSSPSKGESSGSSSKSGSMSSKMEALANFISDKLHLSQKEEVLSEPTIDGLIEYIKSGECKNVITMVGAGISTSAGIPDFRSDSGLYNNLKKYDLPFPEAIFTLDYFHINSKPFFQLAKELYPGTFQPTKCHYFIKLLEEKGLLLRHYTQNIDTLERIAEISEEKLVEAHGSFYTGHCLGCRKEYTLDWMKEKIFDDVIPICEKCPGVVKPDIVFFGENLPLKFFKCVGSDFRKCDLLIVMGSSLMVQPFASFVDSVDSSCPRLLINREVAGHMEFDNPNNYRDVLLLGDCDENCQLLADKLGWSDDLSKLIEVGNKKTDTDKNSTEKQSLTDNDKDKSDSKKDVENSSSDKKEEEKSEA